MSRKNYGMKMTEEDIKAKITENKQRLVLISNNWNILYKK